jgi:DNA polymerase III subunit beta
MTTVKVQRKALIDALRVLGGVTPKKGNIPVLNMVKLTANGTVKMAATDLEYGAVAEIDRMGGRGNATLALPAARLAGIVRVGTGEVVELVTGKGNAVTVDGAQIVGMDPADFPSIPDVTGGELLARIDAQELADAYRNTRYATSTEVVRYALTGILLDLDPNPKARKACMVASDGKRLMRWELHDVTVKKAARMILPIQSLKALVDLIGKCGNEVRVRQKPGMDTQATLCMGGEGVFTRLIDGHFPDYDAVTPANLPDPWSVNRTELLAGLEKMAPVLTDKTMAVRFTFKPGKLTLYARTADVGEAKAELECDGKGEAQVVLNPEYVADYLRALPKGIERVGVAMKDAKCATLWQSTAADRYVLMPLTINL